MSEWCQPGDVDARQWLLVFRSYDYGWAMYEDEAEARAAFEQANLSWDCYLFATAPRAHTIAGSEIVSPPGAVITCERIAEIKARAGSEEPGSSIRDLGAVRLSCMDLAAREVMDEAIGQYRAFWTRHLQAIANAWRNTPEWGGMWESIGADQAYLFAYWLFRHSGLVDAHARADIPWLLERLEHAEAELARLKGDTL